MSFSPTCLTPKDLQDMEGAFTLAISEAGLEIPKDQIHTLLRHAMDTGEGPQQKPLAALEDRRTRKLFWRLINSQMKAGIPFVVALTHIRENRQQLGLPEGYEEVIATWCSMLLANQPSHEFILRHVLPFDFEEAAHLVINSRLSSFQDAMARLVEHA